MLGSEIVTKVPPIAAIALPMTKLLVVAAIAVENRHRPPRPMAGRAALAVRPVTNAAVRN